MPIHIFSGKTLGFLKKNFYLSQWLDLLKVFIYNMENMKRLSYNSDIKQEVILLQLTYTLLPEDAVGLDFAVLSLCMLFLEGKSF